MPVTIAQFVERLRDSGVLDSAEVDAIWANMPAEERDQRAEVLVFKLVADEILSTYQTKALLEDKGPSLVLGHYIVLDQAGDNGPAPEIRARDRWRKRDVTLIALPPEAVANYPAAFEHNGVHYLVQDSQSAAPVIARGGVRPAPRVDKQTRIEKPPPTEIRTPVATELGALLPAAPAGHAQQPVAAQFPLAYWVAGGLLLFTVSGLVLCAGLLVAAYSSLGRVAPGKNAARLPDKVAPPLPSKVAGQPPDKVAGQGAEQNAAPARLRPIDPQAVDEETPLQVTAVVEDDRVPQGTWRYSLTRDAPQGAKIDATTGQFTWTPVEAQGPGSYSIAIHADEQRTDSQAPLSCAPRILRVEVREVVRPPVLAPIADQDVFAGLPFTMAVEATDPERPATLITFLLRDGPGTMSIEYGTGVWRWLPDRPDVGKEYAVTIVATKQSAPPLTVQQTVRVRVHATESESPPSLITAFKSGKLIENSLQMRLALIPPGEFEMGSPATEEQRQETLETQHHVRLTKGFYLGLYEVTQREYEQVMRKTPSQFSKSVGGFMTVGGLDTARFPVESVSWEEATEFCRKLSALEGKTYRLPTEAEWEYACRAGTKSPFHFGDMLSGQEANVNGNPPYRTTVQGVNLARPRGVGAYAPNAFGLYDMHGNVSEWCSDNINSQTRNYAGDAIDPRGADSGNEHPLRGGTWYFKAGSARAASRQVARPEVRLDYAGFRVARDL